MAKQVYTKQKLKQINAFMAELLFIFMLLTSVCIIFMVIAKFKRSSYMDRTPVEMADLDCEIQETGENLYSFTTKTSYVSNGEVFYEVSIGNGKIIVDADTFNKYFGDSKRIKTNIYTFTATNTQKYLKKVAADSTYTQTRLSMLGETPFTEEEEEALKQRAASILTNRKYIALDHETKAENIEPNEYLSGGKDIF